MAISNGKRIFKHLSSPDFDLPKKMIFAFLIWFVLIIAIFGFNGIETGEFYKLNEHMSADVYYEDGTTAHFADGYFGSIKRGDRVEITFDISEKIDLKAAEFYFPVYNTMIELYHGDHLLFSDVVEKSEIDRKYGGNVYEIPLPGDFESKPLKLVIYPTVSLPSSNLDNMGIVAANEGWKFLIKGESMIFTLMLTVMTAALIFVVYYSVNSLKERSMHVGLPIALFELVICAWFFGSMHLFNLIFGNTDFCGKVEYYALYLSPLPLSGFIYLSLDKPKIKKLAVFVTLAYTAFYVVTTAIELSPLNFNYADMIGYLHIMMGITVLTMVVTLFIGIKDASNPYIRILRYGVLASMICGLFELVRFNLIRYVTKTSWISTHGLSSVGIIIIAVALVVYTISYSRNEFTIKIEKEQLMKLAYFDPLTEMPNRAACYREMEKMEKEGVKDYVMVFIDLNNLKLANDTYGHETGDRLLEVTANCIMSTFSEHGFASRWGGDEFVACVLGSETKANSLVDEFNKKMDAENEKKTFEFPVSAACGMYISTSEKYVEPIEAIRKADLRMYEIKKKMKAGR